MKKSTILWAALLALALAFGCSRGTEPGVSEEDHLEDGVLSLMEKHMSAKVVGDSLEVYFPLVNSGEGPLSGEVEITCRHLTDGYSATGDGAFVLDKGDDVVVASVDSLPPFATAGEQAEYVVDYTVRAGSYKVTGRRSLFMLIDKADLLVMVPNELLQGQVTSVRTFLIDPRNGAPIPDQKIKVELLDEEGGVRDTITSKTDATGVAIIEVPADEVGALTLKCALVDGETEEEVEANIQVVRESKLLLTSDKPMYQPGQTMHLRALALDRFDLKPLSEEELVFEVLDSKGNKVFKQQGVTNPYGVGFSQFTLATQVLLGSYTLRATVGDVVSEKTVTVDRYSLPKFKVGVDIEKPYYMAGQTVSGQVSADYFFGKPVAGGKVTVVPYKYEAEWTPLAELEGTTNDAGIYNFSFDLPDYLVGQPLEGGNAMMLMEITVVDTAAHEQKVARNLVIAASPLDVVIVPESGTVVPEVANIFYLFVTDPLGSPVGATCSLTVNGAEFDDDKDEVVIPPMGPASVSLVPHAGILELTVDAEDNAGNTTTQNFNFSVGEDLAAILLRTDKALYSVGDPMEVTVFAAGAFHHIFVDVVRKNQTVLTKTLELEDGVAELTVDLDPELSEDLVIDAYMLAESGQFIRDTKVVYVRPATDLNVEIASDQDEYLPGETATIEFSVTDKEDQPVQSALGIQVVDEAVYALSEIKPGLLKLYFQLEEELANPTYQVGQGTGFTLGGLFASGGDNAVPGSEEEKAVQDMTTAAFAAMDNTPLNHTSVSSWEAALSDMSGVLVPYFDKHKEQIVGKLEKVLAAANKDYYEACGYLQDYLEEPRYYDYWGNAYAFQVTEGDWDCTIGLTSLGPDELEGTEDDWSASLDLWALHGEQWKGGGGGDFAMAGGMEDEGDWDGQAPGPPEANEEPTATSDDDNGGGGGKDDIKVRSWFPETLFFEPSLITDIDGKVSVEIPLADSITEWRMTTMASSRGGHLGSRTDGIVVFQDFFVDIDFPKYLTQNDEITFPIAVYNYLEETQHITVEILPEEWFELLGSVEETLTLGPGEVSVVYFPVKVAKVGWHSLTVYGIGQNEAEDAVKRTVQVMPDGKMIVDTESARFDNDGENVSSDNIDKTVVFPDNSIEGSETIVVKVLPGLSSHVVEGMESMLKLPGG